MEDWGPGISWSNQPAKMGLQDTDSRLRGHRNYCPDDIFQEWTVKTGLVNALNNGEIRYNLGMFSADESNELGWRKYVGPQAAMPSLTVVYNHTPNKPGAINMYNSDGSQSPWSVDRWWVSNGRPQLRANATDPNNGDVIYYQFHVWRSDGWEATFKSSDNVVEGTSGTYQPPADKVFANGNYHWQARACDSDICGSWSNNGMFYVGHVTPTPGSAKTMNENGSSPLMIEGKPWFNVGSRPKVSVVADDYDDHGPLTVEFQALNASDSVIASGTVSNVAVGGTAAWTLPAMSSAGTFGWRARAKDKMGFYSGWMAGQDFVINRLPSKPYGRHVWNDTGIAGVQYQSKDYVRTRYPILQAAPVDPDGNSVRARFRIKQQGATTYLHDWTSSAYASGSTISWVVPGLPEGTYVWEVAGVDISGATSEFNLSTPLVVDLTAPAAPTITDAPHVAAYRGEVEIGVDSTSNDVRFYRYGFQTSTTPESTPELATLGAEATLTRSGHFGPDSVTVAAQDIAGNVSGTTTFSFKVMGASSAHHWRLDDLSDKAERGAAPAARVFRWRFRMRRNWWLAATLPPMTRSRPAEAKPGLLRTRRCVLIRPEQVMQRRRVATRTFSTLLRGSRSAPGSSSTPMRLPTIMSRRRCRWASRQSPNSATSARMADRRIARGGSACAPQRVARRLRPTPPPSMRWLVSGST